MPAITLPQVAHVLGALLPQRRWTHADLLTALRHTQRCNARAKESHAKRRLRLLHKLSL